MTRFLSLVEDLLWEESQSSLLNMAREHESEVGKRASDFSWLRDRRYPLSKFGRRGEWGAWYQQEREDWEADYGDTARFDDLEKWWGRRPSNAPIVVDEETPGKPEVWDGYHRIALSVMRGDQTIDAVVGRKV